LKNAEQTSRGNNVKRIFYYDVSVNKLTEQNLAAETVTLISRFWQIFEKAK